MEVHRQTCQKCGSRDLHNLVVRDQAQPTTIYVKCVDCGELVASYQLNRYYHHGKGIDSWLRGIGADASDSARRQLENFDRIREDSLSGFERAEEELERTGRSFPPPAAAPAETDSTS